MLKLGGAETGSSLCLSSMNHVRGRRLSAGNGMQEAMERINFMEAIRRYGRLTAGRSTKIVDRVLCLEGAGARIKLA